MKKLIGLALTALLLSGCMTRMDSADPEAQAAVQRIADVVMSGRRDRIVELASLPFWMDSWITDADSLRSHFSNPPPGEEPKATGLMVRVYPLGDLAALRPEVWAALKDSNPAYLENLYLAAIRLELDGRSEAGMLLLRKTAKGWQLAGLLEE